MAFVNTSDDAAVVTKNILEIMKIKFKTFSASDFTVLLTSCMSLVESYKTLSGEDKKNIVVEVITMFIDSAPISAEVKQLLHTMLDLLVQSMIDLFVSVANGELLKNFKTCCSKKMCCFPL